MDSLSKNIKELIEKTLEMEKVQDPRLQQMIEEVTDPCNQSQPLLEEKRIEPQPETEQQVVQSLPPEKNQDFYPTEKSIIKRSRVRYIASRIKYSPTRIKSRNFFLNIGYTIVNKTDFYSENFILDVYILLVKNLNPFSLQRKISDKFKQEMIYMLWRECIPTEFYRYICQEENFKYLNGRDISQPGVLEIAGKFIDQDKSNLRRLQQNLANYKDIFQYVYSHTFPEIYSMSEKHGIDLKSNFHILFKAYKDKQTIRYNEVAKQPTNYEGDHPETKEFEQKPIPKFNEFTDEEEYELKEKSKRHALEKQSDEQKAEKRAKKIELDKIKEKQMWEKLNELNSKLKTIKQSKKQEKKMSATIL